ncbi:Transposon Ty3-I Gag-Pol polyprotein [Vitis vinifera]|uniref:Transposon Ty3-I Gag-Pol polyprotein n=1 Tax=Vitis vinifera TaxID=29760 RepID=A0A438IIE8_VITVI|nr:Transposon Ty3-I Gag-Pol polyprotein [Vitis vinifera]
MIQDLSDFKWPRPLGTDPSTRDRSRRCAFHKDHGHTTETCRSFQYLVERLIKAGHLKQYLRSDSGRRDTPQHHNPGNLRAPAAPKAVINYITGDPSDEEYDSRRKRQKLLRAASIRERINSIRPGLTGEGPHPIDGTIIFSTSRSHPDTATASRRPHLVPGNWGLRCAAPRRPWTNPIRIQWVFNYILGRHCTAGPSRPVTLNVQFSVVQELSPFNVILGRTWLHYMKAIPSTYHQMVSFLTNDGQIDLYGSQLAARQCYQIAREAGANHEDVSPPEPALHTTIAIIGSGGQRSPGSGSLTNNPNFGGKRSPHEHPSDRELGAFTQRDKESSGMRLTNCSKPDSSNKFLIQIDQIVDSTSGQGCSSFLDAFFGYHQIPMSPDDEEKTAFITPHGLYCYKVMPFRLKNAGATYQRLMTKIFKPLIGHSVEVYIDDIVVKSETREQHILHLQEVFHLLRKYGMKLNPSKCAFGVSAGKFLGFYGQSKGHRSQPGSSQGSHGNTSSQEQEGVTTPHRQARCVRAFHSPLH